MIPASLPTDYQIINGYLIGPDANLTNADLSFANLTNANLTNAALSGVRSGGITGTPASLPTDYQIINGYLIGPDVNLSFVNLPGADLTGADLTDAYLFGITWSNTRCPNGVVQSTQCPRTAAG